MHNRFVTLIDESLGEGCNHGAWLAMRSIHGQCNGVNCRLVVAEWGWVG